MDEQEKKIDSRKVIKISRKKFIITTVIVVVILILVFLSRYFLSSLFVGGPTSINLGSLPPINMPGSYEKETRINNLMSDGQYGGGYQQPDITDTREFLKTNYSANIQTRKVKDVTTEVKNIIKGADGRIDNIHSSEKNGFISFVVPKSNFEVFKNEIESITHKKLFTDNESSQNLLSQKQGIESTTESIINTLENLNNQKNNLAIDHQNKVNIINREITRIKNELATIRLAISSTTDQTALYTLRNQETSLINQESTQKKLLSNENSSFTIQNQNLENSISYQNSNLTNINKVDGQFTDNIETVNGSVNITWVNLWEIAKIFSPISPIIIIIFIVLVIGYYLKRKNYIPRVEFQ